MVKLYLSASCRHVDAVRHEHVGPQTSISGIPPNQHRLAIVMSTSTSSLPLHVLFANPVHDYAFKVCSLTKKGTIPVTGSNVSISRRGKCIHPVFSPLPRLPSLSSPPLIREPLPPSPTTIKENKKDQKTPSLCVLQKDNPKSEKNA
jgi:hypothetical protein